MDALSTLIVFIDDNYQVMIVILIFSVIQSMFGMGLLVFGTPTLLLMGHNFPNALEILLPASVVISFSQVFAGRNEKAIALSELFIYCLPAIAIGLMVIIFSPLTHSIHIPIGIALLVSSIMRNHTPLQDYFRVLLTTHSRSYHVAMGLLHGTTNLGGAMLAIKATVEENNKINTRSFVATYYYFFGLIQMVSLSLFFRPPDMIAFMIYAVIALLSHMFVGRAAFKAINDAFYNPLFSIFTAVYGLLLIFK